MFPVYVLDIQTVKELPEPDIPFFVVAKEGTYLCKRSALGKSIIPYSEPLEHLKSIEYSSAGIFWFTAPKLPAAFMGQVTSFFRSVWHMYKTEAEILILFNGTTQRYSILVPDQTCSAAGVESKYNPSEIPDGFQLVGSIHSHCNFGAFHSGTDISDASSFNGLHITIGQVDKDVPEFAAMVMDNGVQFNYPAEILADTTHLWTKKFPSRWLKKITVATATKPKPTSVVKYSGPTNDDFKDWWGKKWGKKDNDGNKNQIWSWEFQCYVDKDYLSNGQVKDEFVIDVLEERLEELRKIAAIFGLDVDWWLKDMLSLDEVLPPDTGKTESLQPEVQEVARALEMKRIIDIEDGEYVE